MSVGVTSRPWPGCSSTAPPDRTVCSWNSPCTLQDTSGIAFLHAAYASITLIAILFDLEDTLETRPDDDDLGPLDIANAMCALALLYVEIPELPASSEISQGEKVAMVYYPLIVLLYDSVLVYVSITDAGKKLDPMSLLVNRTIRNMLDDEESWTDMLESARRGDPENLLFKEYTLIANLMLGRGNFPGLRHAPLHYLVVDGLDRKATQLIQRAATSQSVADIRPDEIVSYVRQVGSHVKTMSYADRSAQ
eukprot:TRINITY_DN10398_c0_g1_i1.p2 TRINITY_DN10398_c0_g1~~TRINITY_DN10398_c0_g1_i1.p2  ORF type:complete len:250 (+),score=28.13 TRINITY_DN10398_c0_g1_i1:1070-1819(+)